MRVFIFVIKFYAGGIVVGEGRERERGHDRFSPYEEIYNVLVSILLKKTLKKAERITA